MPNYCECSFPALYYAPGKCGRCLRRIESEPEPCPTCNGEGGAFLEHASTLSPWVECKDCGGSGVPA